MQFHIIHCVVGLQGLVTVQCKTLNIELQLETTASQEQYFLNSQHASSLGKL